MMRRIKSKKAAAVAPAAAARALGKKFNPAVAVAVAVLKVSS
jgi:hypothetical protein